MAGGGELMLLVGAAVGWFLIGPAVNGPVMSIVDKFGSAVGGIGGSSGSRGKGTSGTGGPVSGTSSYNAGGGYNAMVGGMITHYPN